MKPFEELWDWLKKRMSDSTLMLGVLLVLGAIAATNGREVVVAVVKDEVAPVRRRVDEHDTRLAEHAQKFLHQSDDTHELGKDVRALYQTVLTRQRQERLEAPFPVVAHDGGVP